MATAATADPTKTVSTEKGEVHFDQVDANIGVFLTFGALVLVVVGSTLPHFVSVADPGRDYYSLWRRTQCVEQNSTALQYQAYCTITWAPAFCTTDLYAKFVGSSAFALISDVFAFLAFVFATLEALGHAPSQYITLILTFFTTCTLAVTWGIIAGVNSLRDCDKVHYFSQNYNYGPGFGIVCGAFALSAAAFIVFLRRNVEHVKQNFTLFAVLILLLTSSALTVIGTAISQFVSIGNNDNTITLWSAHECLTEGGSCGSQAVVDFQCKQQTDQLKASAAFAVISIAVTLVAFILGALDFIGRGIGLIATAAVAFSGVITLAVAWGIIAGQYDTKLCSSGIKVSTQYYFGAGYACLVAAFVCAGFATLKLGGLLWHQHQSAPAVPNADPAVAPADTGAAAAPATANTAAAAPATGNTAAAAAAPTTTTN